MSPQDKLLDKLAKLQAAREGEAKLGNMEAAEAFASMINRLLLQHELSEVDIELHKRDDDPIVEITVDRQAAGIPRVNRRVGWQEALAHLVAKANLCRFLVRPGTNIITFVGTKPHAVMAEYAYGVLASSAERMSIRARNQWVNEQRKAGTYNGGTEGFRNAWFQGFTTRIGERFEEEKAKAVAETGDSSTALIRLDQALIRVQEFMAEKYTKKASGLGGGRHHSADGLRAGRRAADQMNLGQRGIGSGSTKVKGVLR